MNHSRKPRDRSAQRARRALRDLIQSPPSAFLAPADERWYRLYTRRIARYLLEHLTDEELRDWETAYTALHELVAQAFAVRPRHDDALHEPEAWARVSAEEHFATAACFTLLPMHRAFAKIDVASSVRAMPQPAVVVSEERFRVTMRRVPRSPSRRMSAARSTG